MPDYIAIARQYRPIIEKAAVSLDDTDALTAPGLFPRWKPRRGDKTMHYAVDDRVRDNDVLYRCITEHDAQDGWNPSAAPSLWAKVLIPDPNTIPGWEQTDSTNAYSKGDKVTHKGKTWVSIVDGNVWEPGVYGWVEST